MEDVDFQTELLNQLANEPSGYHTNEPVADELTNDLSGYYIVEPIDLASADRAGSDQISFFGEGKGGSVALQLDKIRANECPGLAGGVATQLQGTVVTAFCAVNTDSIRPKVNVIECVDMGNGPLCINKLDR